MQARVASRLWLLWCLAVVIYLVYEVPGGENCGWEVAKFALSSPQWLPLPLNLPTLHLHSCSTPHSTLDHRFRWLLFPHAQACPRSARSLPRMPFLLPHGPLRLGLLHLHQPTQRCAPLQHCQTLWVPSQWNTIQSRFGPPEPASCGSPPHAAHSCPQYPSCTAFSKMTSYWECRHSNPSNSSNENFVLAPEPLA